MAPDEPTEMPAPEPATGDEPPEGVFGNLPHTRPGARSPRRDAGPGARPRARETSGPARPRAEAPRAQRPPEGAQEGPGDVPGPDAHEGGIEDVAWAGVAAAAEAATIGVRLATRALEAMRDAVDRR